MEKCHENDFRKIFMPKLGNRIHFQLQQTRKQGKSTTELCNITTKDLFVCVQMISFSMLPISLARSFCFIFISEVSFQLKLYYIAEIHIWRVGDFMTWSDVHASQNAISSSRKGQPNYYNTYTHLTAHYDRPKGAPSNFRLSLYATIEHCERIFNEMARIDWFALSELYVLLSIQ